MFYLEVRSFGRCLHPYKTGHTGSSVGVDPMRRWPSASEAEDSHLNLALQTSNPVLSVPRTVRRYCYLQAIQSDCFLFPFEIGSHLPLALNLLGVWGWPWTSDPPPSTSQSAGIAEAGTQSCLHARWALFQLSHTPSSSVYDKLF